MKAPLLTLRMLLRLSFLAQAVLGIVLLVSFSQGLKSIHVIVGVVFVFCLWAIAAMAMGSGARRPLAIVTVLWGFVMIVFGLAQGKLLASDHWIIDVLHILAGIIGLGLGEVLGAATARRISSSSATTSAAPES